MRSLLRLLLFVSLFAGLSQAASAKFSVLFSFCDACALGRGPSGALLRDAEGNLYGTTGLFGSIAYRLSPSGEFTVLHRFCVECGEGQGPVGKLVMDVRGNLYGATEESGGVVFRLSPNKTGKKWKIAVLHKFCTKKDCRVGVPLDGLTYDAARSGALYDGVSPLYGTTAILSGGPGSIFSITPQGKRRGAFKILYRFCSKANCADGRQPQAALLPDGAGNFYGTAADGGDVDHPGGVAFKFAKSGNAYRYSVIHTFCESGSCVDGTGTGPLTWGADGKLVGVGYGGTHDFGVVYKLSTNGASHRVLYNFCSVQDCADGNTPNTVTTSPDGTIWGTTEMGGLGQWGVLFKLQGEKLKVVHHFCTDGACSDGILPQGAPIFDAGGNIYGTAEGGGDRSSGTLYKIEP